MVPELRKELDRRRDGEIRLRDELYFLRKRIDALEESLRKMGYHHPRPPSSSIREEFAHDDAYAWWRD